MNYVWLLENAAKTAIRRHSVIMVYTCVQYVIKTGILHVLIGLLLSWTMTLFGVRSSENAVYVAELYLEYCLTLS